MIFVGCDVGSLTAKAVVLVDSKIISTKIIRAKATALKSANAVTTEALASVGLSFKNINFCCSTGYGRFSIPFADINTSEISCHGLGAFWIDNSIRTVIDIGGQDCKAVSIDENGFINDFIMNEKCAAGTGRSLELLSKAIGVELHELGNISLEAEKHIEISNKCSIFMELDVMKHLYGKQKKSDIAYAINNAVAKRVFQLTRSIDIKKNICITGGVSKNIGVVRILEKLLGMSFKPLTRDPQATGAIGAAIFAMQEYERLQKQKEKRLEEKESRYAIHGT